MLVHGLRERIFHLVFILFIAVHGVLVILIDLVFEVFHLIVIFFIFIILGSNNELDKINHFFLLNHSITILVKVFENYSETSVKTAFAEREAAKMQHHPNVITMFGCGEAPVFLDGKVAS